MLLSSQNVCLVLTLVCGATSRAISRDPTLLHSSSSSTPFGFLLAPRPQPQLPYNLPSPGASSSRRPIRSSISLLARRPGPADLPASASVPPLSSGTQLVGNDSPHIRYAPADAWQNICGPYYLTGSTRRTRPDADSASSVTFSFVGQGLDWRGSRSPDHGQAEVRLDGKVVQIVDAYSSRYLDRQLLASIRDLKHGHHEVEIVQLNTKQRRSTGYLVDVDSFVVFEAQRPKRASLPVGRGPSSIAAKLEVVSRNNGMLRLGNPKLSGKKGAK